LSPQVRRLAQAVKDNYTCLLYWSFEELIAFAGANGWLLASILGRTVSEIESYQASCIGQANRVLAEKLARMKLSQ
jgi:hypothetical protein